MKVGNGLMFALAALCNSAWTWINGKSEFFTALINAGEDDSVEVSRLQVIHFYAGMCAFLLLLGVVGTLEAL